MKILIPFYSTYGHVYKMAEAIAEGVEKVEGVNAELRRIEEAIPEETLKEIGAFEAQKDFAHIPECNLDDLKEADGIIIGTPTRFGNIAGQVQNFLDTTGSLWMEGALIGKVGSVFVSTASQHGGQETTIRNLHTTLLHHGMIIVGLPYSFAGQGTIDEISGGSPYGATTIAGSDGSRMPSENELEGARFQGEHVAKIVAKMTV
ncbi:NAD(P)H:quinone oxidoreductase [Halonatronum saccharophilum]|uniref:NAD(P)H:quinone oxidoreductase n=1 Tax=Halonatronum saccharophilum TaxID=150060 RepID=UPI0004800D08|nr:NAD(P)H:quinone oxidoreductase [Halonatronum saccharophilum]